MWKVECVTLNCWTWETAVLSSWIMNNGMFHPSSRRTLIKQFIQVMWFPHHHLFTFLLWLTSTLVSALSRLRSLQCTRTCITQKHVWMPNLFTLHLSSHLSCVLKGLKEFSGNFLTHSTVLLPNSNGGFLVFSVGDNLVFFYLFMLTV